MVQKKNNYVFFNNIKTSFLLDSDNLYYIETISNIYLNLSSLTYCDFLVSSILYVIKIETKNNIVYSWYSLLNFLLNNCCNHQLYSALKQIKIFKKEKKTSYLFNTKIK